jgi:hypothetical protein
MGEGAHETSAQLEADQPNPALALEATKEADAAQSKISRTGYPSADAVENALAPITQPIEDNLHVEISNKIDRDPNNPKNFGFGPAFSNGLHYGVFEQTGENVAGWGEGSQVGYYHTHPNNIGFSASDRHQAYEDSLRYGPQTAYVSMPNGHSFAWDSKSVQDFNYNGTDYWNKIGQYDRQVR